MTLRPEYSLGHSELNDFLYAVVGEEKNGTQLTVLSALARLDLDPWEEAARLSRLTKEAATNTLAATIDSLPNGDWAASDTRSIAVRLVDRLPRHLSSAAKSSPARSPMNKNVANRMLQPEVLKRALWIGLIVALATSLWNLFGQ